MKTERPAKSTDSVQPMLQLQLHEKYICQFLNDLRCNLKNEIFVYFYLIELKEKKGTNVLYRE